MKTILVASLTLCILFTGCDLANEVQVERSCIRGRILSYTCAGSAIQILSGNFNAEWVQEWTYNKNGSSITYQNVFTTYTCNLNDEQATLFLEAAINNTEIEFAMREANLEECAICAIGGVSLPEKVYEIYIFDKPCDNGITIDE